MASCRKENVQRHVLRLLLHLHHRVAPARLQALQKALEPTGQVGATHPYPGGCLACPAGCPTTLHFPQSGEAVKELYSQLSEKLEQLDHRKPSPAQAAETPTLELPLPTVPAPAGL